MDRPELLVYIIFLEQFVYELATPEKWWNYERVAELKNLLNSHLERLTRCISRSIAATVLNLGHRTCTASTICS